MNRLESHNAGLIDSFAQSAVGGDPVLIGQDLDRSLAAVVREINVRTRRTADSQLDIEIVCLMVSCTDVSDVVVFVSRLDASSRSAQQIRANPLLRDQLSAAIADRVRGARIQN
jgi:hypothetical protein